MKNIFFLIKKTNQKKIFFLLISFSIFLAFYEVFALSLIAAFLSFLGNGTINERIIESLSLLDFFFNYKKILQIKIFIFFLVFLFVTKNLLSFLFLKTISKFLINFKRNITTQLFLNYLNLSYKNFTKEDPSNLLNSIMYDCEQIKIFFYEALITLKEVVTLTILIFIFIYFVHQFQAVNFIIILFFLSIFIVYLIKKNLKN
jgi:ABC-type multidrug transport system fused ATPase/permease subunit